MARTKARTTVSQDVDLNVAKSRSSKRAIGQADTASKRTYVRQLDVPIASLDDALRLPQAIFEHYAGKPTSPFNVAKALKVDPKGSQLRLLSGAAIAFGLIEGGAQASSITVTELARKIIRPKAEGEDYSAKREAVLRPRIFGEFLRNYDGNVFPRSDIALNVLEGMGVPREKVKDILDRITESARSVGFIEELKGKSYVRLDVSDVSALSTTLEPPITSAANDEMFELEAGNSKESKEAARIVAPPPLPMRGAAMAAAAADDHRRRRVFVTHGKDRALVEPIKKLLEYGELEPVVAVERQSVSKPVPEKVMDDMRQCGAAIIHVDADTVITDGEGNDHVILNPNVLIEIGAAMAFYGRRFILLVRNGVKLPSNLQGLYEVRYSGDAMDAGATIALLEAMKDIKNYPLPNDSE